MQEWQLDINCPLCDVKFLAKRAQKHRNKKHRNKKHPDIEMDAFVDLIRMAVERGDDVLNTKRGVTEGARLSGRYAFSKDVRNSVKYVSIVSGGAIGLGKKK